MYDLSSVNLPKLVGQPLKLFAGVVESRLGQALLIPKLLKDGGISKLRQEKIDEPPTYYPLVPPQNISYTPTKLSDLADSILAQKTAVPFHTVADYAKAYQTGKVTPLAVAEAFLAAVDDVIGGERPLNIFININHQDILQQAQAATERYQNGTPLSILDGVPVAIKDEMDMFPYPTTVGTSFWGKQPTQADSTVVSRLRAAGTLLLGKANMYEIGISPEGFNGHYGAVRNPHNLDHDSGGSSSGSAAAVAVGFCPVAIGADGGGSIRVPAAHCGLVGLKATYGRISTHGGAPLDWSVAHIGPIGLSVDDVALAYTVIAGADENDPNTAAQPPVHVGNYRNKDLSQLKIGIFRDWFNHASPEIVQTCSEMVAHFEKGGASILEIELPELDNMRIAHAVTILSEMAASMTNLKAAHKSFAPPTRVNLAIGRATTAHDYLQAQRMRTRALNIFKSVFGEVDLIVTPATAVTAPQIPPNSGTLGWNNLNVVTELMRYVFVGNLTGLPAISFPVGYDAANMPIGMQMMANHWHEHHLFQIAAFAEGIVERKWPSTFIDILNI